MLAIPTIATLFTVTAIVPRLALATIDNTCEAQRLTKAASDFGRGYYEIVGRAPRSLRVAILCFLQTNAATGEKISYKKQNGRWLYPAKDQASTAMELIVGFRQFYS